MKNKAKSAFTLVELLIVIAIIGVLSATLVGLFGGSSDAARATQCMTNMRGLAVAAINYTIQQPHGEFPAAGSHKYIDYAQPDSGRYPWRTGWVSWNYPNPSARSKTGGSPISFSESDPKLLRFALTNGCIWTCGGRSEKIYQCPVHDAACLKANKRHPGWSYVMNESFYWAEGGAGKPLGGWHAQTQSGLAPYDSTLKKAVGRPADKVLLFAEIQGLDDAKRGLKARTNESGDKGDGVLQYKSANELMGFNHKQSGGKLAGHVSFADGHVEKLLYPASGGIDQLTKWLCSGRAVSFNGRQYQDMQSGN